MAKLLSLVKSRRFWAAVVGAIVSTVMSELGFDDSTVLSVVGIVTAWIIGDSLNKTE